MEPADSQTNTHTVVNAFRSRIEQASEVRDSRCIGLQEKILFALGSFNKFVPGNSVPSALLLQTLHSRKLLTGQCCSHQG